MALSHKIIQVKTSCSHIFLFFQMKNKTKQFRKVLGSFQYLFKHEYRLFRSDSFLRMRLYLHVIDILAKGTYWFMGSQKKELKLASAVLLFGLFNMYSTCTIKSYIQKVNTTTSNILFFFSYYFIQSLLQSLLTVHAHKIYSTVWL